MASDNNNEPARLLLPYLQRADELQKHDPLVAYYCRLFAMEKGLKIPQSERTKTTNSLLVSLINQLEKDKKSLTLGPEDNLHLEGFALNVFAKADKQDRAGRADLSTAKTFYAASIFFEILNQFGALQPDLEQKQKYAVWKAADIRKAMKEGRKPTPGPPAGDDDLALSGEFDLGSIETTAANPRSEFDPSPQLHDHTVPDPRSEYDPSTQFHDQVNGQHSTNVPPSQKFHEKANDQHSAPIQPPQYHDSVRSQHSTDVLLPSSTSSYPTSGYQSHDFHPPPAPPPPTNRSENSGYSQTYHHQSYSQDPQLHLPQNYLSHDTSSYPNFQSYPSFAESSLPAVPSHFPSYYQGSESSYSTQSAPPTTSYPSTPQYPSSSRNEASSDPVPSSTQTFQYDSNYQPPPEKIAEAHKAARFAVGALAFDDVSVAVDFLKKSLELLTNPSAAR